MIYHILNDEKFSDWIISSFDELNPDENRFILVSDREETDFLDVNHVEKYSVSNFLKEINPSPSDLIIFYYLHLHNIKFLSEKRLTCRKIWVGYGSDYYYYLLNTRRYGSLYLQETKGVFNILNRKNVLKKLLLPVFQEAFFHFKVKKALKNLDYFSPIIKNEFALVKQLHPSLNFKNLDFSFGDIDYLLGVMGNSMKISGTKVLVGNSATYANNHLDILTLLKETGIKNRLLIPLSYGNEKYKAYLIEYCQKNFGGKCELLEKYIPRAEYYECLKDCGFVIMGHLRQQGMGNIYAILYMGAKLFLFKKNPVYAFLKEMGVIVFTIEDLASNPSHLSFCLSTAEKQINRDAIKSFYSKDAVLERLKKILEL